MEEAVMDTQESTTMMKGPREAEPYPIKFSASYASRYHNCHGSANLEQAIEGFQHPERNERGMKGEGTICHKIFQEVLEQCEDIVEAATLLTELAGLYYTTRRPLIDDKMKYITWWFLTYKTKPPVPWEIINKFHWTTVAESNGIETFNSVPPRRMVFLAEALRYTFDIIDGMEGAVILTEKKVTAEWLTTRPKTTADVVIYDSKSLHVLDLKMGDIEVSPMGNEQLMYYAVTYMKDLKLDPEDINVHIVQRNNMDYYPLTKAGLDKWIVSMQESEAAILDGDLTLSPGNHCTFCPANPHGRGDRGTKSCPAMLQILYGDRDAAEADNEVIGEDYDDE